jgi:hypothetical protein
MLVAMVSAAEPSRQPRFAAPDAPAARQWQHQARQKLFELAMGGVRPDVVPLDPQLLSRTTNTEDG